MNIPEYYQYEAERCDNGEMVRGLRISERYIKPENYGIIYRNIKSSKADMHCKVVEVKPETVRRVAVKPIIEQIQCGVLDVNQDTKCPNCKCSFDFIDFDTLYCPDCGMAIDWSDNND